MPRAFAFLNAALATGAMMWLQSLIRDLWQIRTLPERVMEWSLLFIPLDLFEQGIQRFGSNAKELALWGNSVGMAVTLLLVGFVLLRAGVPGWGILGAAVIMWLGAMGVVMPVTGGGFFATGLFQAPALVNAGFLAGFLLYGTVLLGGAALWRSLDAVRVQQAGARADSRRAFLASAAGLVAAWAGALWLGRDGGGVTSSLPLAQAPVPTAVPSTAQPPVAVPGLGVAPPPTAALPTPEPLPVPGPSRKLERDKDGTLTAATRSKGTLPDLVPPTEQHYVVTKNATSDPMVDPSSWRLIIDGEVNQPIQLDYRTLRQLPSVELVKTLECISNMTAMCELTPFGCDLIGTARWRGVQLSEIIALAGGLKASAGSLSAVSLDEFSAGLPLAIIDDPDTLVVYEMNGAVLPREHGYPARLLVPGRYGFKSPKWLAAIRPVQGHYADWYEQRNWSKTGFVKTMSRIDVPENGGVLPTGSQRIAGIAYAGNRGIRSVELSPDEGRTWAPARFIEPPVGKDAWVRWEALVSLGSGIRTTLVVRATDGTGETQTDEFKLPQPDGGSGRHSIEVRTA